MSFLQKIIDQVGVTARQKGVKIRGKGGVTVQQATAASLSAMVKADDQVYHVSLLRDADSIEYSCSCNEFAEEGVFCEHAWAAVLQAESQELLQGWGGKGKVKLEPAVDDNSDVDEDDEDDDEDLGELEFVTLEEEEQRERDRDDPEDKFILRFPGAFSGGKGPSRPKGKGDDWRAGFEVLREAMNTRPAFSAAWPATRQILYVIDIAETLRGAGLTVEIMTQERKKDGNFGKARHEALGSDDAARLPDPDDAEIIAILGGAQRDGYGYYYSTNNRSSRYRVSEVQYATLIRRMCQTGRCRLRLRPNNDYLTPVQWDDSVWEFWIVAPPDPQSQRFVLEGELRCGDRRMKLSEPKVLLSGGLLFTETQIARFDHQNAFAWVILLRRQGNISVPREQGDELLAQILTMPQVPRLQLPEELTFEKVAVAPKPRLRIKKPQTRNDYYGKPKLVAELSFDYDGHIVPSAQAGQGIYQAENRRMIARDADAERAALQRLHLLGFREPRSGGHGASDDLLELAPSLLPTAIRVLLNENWFVEADGKLYRQAGEFKMEVSSGIDWFELHGNVDFGGLSVGLPELLRALRRGEKTIQLDDGTFGVLPEQWLQKYGLLAGMGEEQKDHVRFGKTQVGLLDALLMAQPQVQTDALFEQARQRLRDFGGVTSAEPPATFVGKLRPYQREGLGWLEFLRNFGFGGCLADDMGLGKTVQVLALLEERRLLREASPAASGGNGDGAAPRRPGPSIVVAPRSLVFNWTEEAARFAPKLRVLDHTGIARAKSAAGFDAYDLILTTYGTLRNDIAFLKDLRFDYVVLDEAQAVKNASSESAKAARLLSGDHRLALSGTPVQNHLGELWSLFEFLNPGMLGAAKAFAVSGAGNRAIDESSRLLLSRALRPFILRRTKAQVAQDLPQRLEQTIHCELDAKQRKLYDDLKEHYRQSLLTKIAVEGIAKNKIQVLEALLRLRQAACHPGLIDKAKVDERSAKLDALLPQLAEVTDGGHKALVFSQFTSMLSIVRARLDQDKIPYAYLDGRTRDRQAVVEQFQKDDNCRLFLISLKAGGVGLNLTAAEYVFLLDPWWNPAVEAQAIDRAHRIGQTRQVFAYRLIAKDTVEEKVLQLQNTKRELADAIINADNSVIGKLGREDLELLLS